MPRDTVIDGMSPTELDYIANHSRRDALIHEHDARVHHRRSLQQLVHALHLAPSTRILEHQGVPRLLPYRIPRILWTRVRGRAIQLLPDGGTGLLHSRQPLPPQRSRRRLHHRLGVEFREY